MFRQNFKMKIALSLFFASAIALSSNAQQKWDVPAAQKAKNSYVVFDAGATKEGESIYKKNCASCHGDPGKGNSMKTLTPPPPDLSGDKTKSLTDGELFYILNTGRGVMPSFKNTLSETDRWKVIAYIRSFHKGYVQVVSKTDPNKSKLVKVNTTFNKATNTIHISVKANLPTGVVALQNSEVALFADRYFGKLQIEKAIRTDAQGNAVFNFPKDLPGDKVGNVGLTIKINDESYGEIESQSKMQIGIPTDKPALTKDRAMWNVMKKAPWWILITYFGCLSVVIGFFVFLLKNLKKIKDLGEQK